MTRETDFDKLEKSRTILLGLPIGDEVATETIAKLLFLRSTDARSPIQIIINSPGGSITASLAILDTMSDLNLVIRTHCLRFCAGMAAIILAHGTKGERTANPASEISLSRTRVGLEITSEEVQSNHDHLMNTLVTLMAKDTHQSSAQLRKDMFHERVFTPAEAQNYGLIDWVRVPRIIES